MVLPYFGWSVGDIAVAITILYKISTAFKEAGGAVDQYSETISFLEVFALTLNRLKEYTLSNAEAKFSNDIVDQVKIVSAQYTRFEDYLQTYDPTLSSKPTKKRIKAVGKKVKWAIDELREKVNELKAGVSNPLMFIHPLLSLQLLSACLRLMITILKADTCNLQG